MSGSRKLWLATRLSGPGLPGELLDERAEQRVDDYDLAVSTGRVEDWTKMAAHLRLTRIQIELRCWTRRAGEHIEQEGLRARDVLQTGFLG